MITNDQWKDIEQALSNPMFGSVEFSIPPFKQVTFEVRRYKDLQFCILPFVNGSFLGQWLHRDGYLQQWFFRKRSRSIHSEKGRKRAVRRCGKKFAEEIGYFKKIEWYEPHWFSFKPLKNRLKRLEKEREIKILRIGHKEFE